MIFSRVQLRRKQGESAVLLRLDGDGSLYHQVYRALLQAIENGSLAPGAKLPASRAFAREAQLSRNTILQAYEQLVREGYAVTRPGAGTFVVDPLPEAFVTGAPPPQSDELEFGAPPAPAARLSAYGQRASEAWGRAGLSWSLRRPSLPYDFRYGEPAYDDFPLATWSRLLERHARAISKHGLGYGEPGGYGPLREALAAYLGRARGVRCSADRLIIVHGSQQAINLVARILVDPGTRVAVEDPGYTGFRVALVAAGAEVAAVPVDAHGLDIDALENLRDVRLACVTPSHQFPSGAVMPLARRRALLAWAKRCDAYLLEDDYDSEFRFDGPPIESLQGLDDSSRVIYVGTLSKVMFPSLRMGFVVAPPALHTPLLAAKAIADTGSAGLEQRALAEFIAEGHFERHLRRARTRTASRRAALLAALEEHLGDRALVSGENAGLHLVVWLPGHSASVVPELRRRAADAGVGVYPVQGFYSEPPERAGLLLGYGALSEEHIREGIRRLSDVVPA